MKATELQMAHHSVLIIRLGCKANITWVVPIQLRRLTVYTVLAA